MDSSAVELLKLPLFNGEHNTFQVWWMRFMTYAGMFGFIKALRKGGETDMPESNETLLDATTELGKKQEAAKKRNVIAMANLTMAFTSEGTIALV